MPGIEQPPFEHVGFDHPVVDTRCARLVQVRMRACPAFHGRPARVANSQRAIQGSACKSREALVDFARFSNQKPPRPRITARPALS
jgi:hypothetical protein